MMLTRRPSLGPVRARALQCFGADVNVTEIRGLVCQPEDQGPAIGALERHFAGAGDRWHWIDWGGVREDGTARGELKGGTTGWERQTPSYYLPLPASWEELRRRLPRNIKESLRKCYNSLKRSHHAFELRVAQSPAEAPAALHSFFELHRERAHAAARTKHSDVFGKLQDRAFICDYAQRMAERGQLRIFLLHVDGRVVASRMGFVLGEELYLYYSGYQMRWAAYSVMTTLLAETIRWAIEQRLRIISLSTGNDVSKLRWRPHAVVFRSALQVAPRWQAGLAFRVYRRLLEARSRDSSLGKLLIATRR
jgi:CelD/BcsL family acetyltransferase involved in cellulose biosynthesis